MSSTLPLLCEPAGVRVSKFVEEIKVVHTDREETMMMADTCTYNAFPVEILPPPDLMLEDTYHTFPVEILPTPDLNTEVTYNTISVENSPPSEVIPIEVHTNRVLPNDISYISREEENFFLNNSFLKGKHENILINEISKLPDSVNIPHYFLETFSTFFERDHATVATLQIPPVQLQVVDTAMPRFVKSRPIPLAIQSTVVEQIKEMVSSGVLEPIQYSPWASPLVIVRKGDGGLRLCVDYKITVNKYLVPIHYQIPLVNDIYSKLANCILFTKLDLKSAYNQVPLAYNSRIFTTVSTPIGLFQYTVLPFGLNTAPSLFQQIIEIIISGLAGVSGYLDDIIIGGTTEEERIKFLSSFLRYYGRLYVFKSREVIHFTIFEVRETYTSKVLSDRDREFR
jgi:hypothetical protein